MYPYFPCGFMSRHPLVVIGGGGGGLVAAARAASMGTRVVLLERNRRLGIKLRISGGGKCNITHAGPMESLLTAFRPPEARFLKHAFFRCTNRDVLRRIAEEGVPTFAREDGRVFPVSGRADDVVEALTAPLRRAGVDIRLESRVTSLAFEGESIAGAVVDGNLVPSSHIIVATGGVSYPKTGTTGDGFIWLASLGHTIIPLRPALAPMRISPPLPGSWRGVALRNGRLSVFSGGTKVAGWNGDVLFTHEGLSGPATLEVSRTAAQGLEEGTVTVYYDFFPSKEFTELDADLQKEIRTTPSRMIATLLNAWLPNRIVSHLLHSMGIAPETRGYQLTREQRRAISRLLKSWEIGRVSQIDRERGEVTAGGVSLEEVDPRSMRSRKVRGLYLCGEVLDIAGSVGGYNLQAAFSTGFLAGESAARDWLDSAEGHSTLP